MPRSFDKHDREYLVELMQYFPVTPPISLDAAEEQIKDFCNNQPSGEEFTEELKTLPDQASSTTALALNQRAKGAPP